MDRAQFGKDGADKDLRFGAEKDAIVVVGDPDAGAAEFFVWLKLEVLADPVEAQIAFDRVIAAGAHGNFLAADDRQSGEISRGRGINDDAINAVIAQRLAAQIKHRSVQIV